MRENRFLLVETNLNKPKEPKKKSLLSGLKGEKAIF